LDLRGLNIEVLISIAEFLVGRFRSIQLTSILLVFETAVSISSLRIILKDFVADNRKSLKVGPTLLS
jgi:hypothetical protein